LIPNIIISLPTFIIAECVLIYLDPDSSRAIVNWSSKTFSTAVFFLYEQVSSTVIFLVCIILQIRILLLMCLTRWVSVCRSIQMMHLGIKWLEIWR